MNPAIEDCYMFGTRINETTLENNIKIFPNPASSFITLTVPGDLPIEEAIIYNHFGQKVLTAKPVNNTVDVSGLKAGMYLVESITKDSRFRDKLIKNN
ncbi:MAG: T9SS type A sorting domain-containing protein [Bacteroidetes bacterium]|nr:T9SS type A sorting domain-containing protein [Bacteroidota bacterium]